MGVESAHMARNKCSTQQFRKFIHGKLIVQGNFQ